MSRNFQRDNTDYITITESSEFSSGSAWSFLWWMYLTDTDADENMIISKHTDGSVHVWIFVDGGVSPQNFVIRVDGVNAISTTSSYAEGTWYANLLANDGSGNLSLWTLEADGTQLLTDTGTYTWTSSAQDLAIGLRGVAGSADPADGLFAHYQYYTTEFVKADLELYLRNPAWLAGRESANLLWWLPLDGSSPEVDWSGNGNSGAVTGTIAIGDNPPVAPLFGFDIGWPPPVAAGVADRSVSETDTVTVAEDPTILVAEADRNISRISSDLANWKQGVKIVG
jgi:hypothetical protein